MRDDDTPPEGQMRAFSEQPQAGAVDRLLKWMIPNGTVMRRWILGAYIGGLLFGTVAAVLINKTSDNTVRSERAICSVISYAEQRADEIHRSPSAPREAAEGLMKLADDMRATGVHCLPRRQFP